MPDHPSDLDQLLLEEYLKLDLPEIRALARGQGFMIPDSYMSKDIAKVLLGHTKPEEDPLSIHREAFMSWLAENWEYVADALGCDGDCRKHPTELFLFCLQRSGRAETHFSTASKRGRKPRRRR